MTIRKIALCTWNIWGDEIIDRPSNTDEISISNIVNWLLQKHECTIYQFQKMNAEQVFKGRLSVQRSFAYHAIRPIDNCAYFPDVDMVFIRWRWPLHKDGIDERISIQNKVLAYYLRRKDTKIVIWDDDFKLSDKEKKELIKKKNLYIVEISEAAKEKSRASIKVPYPIDINEEDLHKELILPGSGYGDHLDSNFACAYVGNNYEREDLAIKFFSHLSMTFPRKVHLFGNWLKYSTRLRDIHPDICFHPKVGKDMIDWIYSHSYCVPMLAKDVYFERGHITPRLYEVLINKCIPIGFKMFKNHDKYFNLSVSNPDELTDLVTRIYYKWDNEKRSEENKLQLELIRKSEMFSTEKFCNIVFNL